MQPNVTSQIKWISNMRYTDLYYDPTSPNLAYKQSLSLAEGRTSRRLNRATVGKGVPLTFARL